MCRIVMFIGSIWLTCALLFNGCSSNQVTGGTSTSENGRVVGKIVTIDGVPAVHAQVALIPSAYDPVKEIATFATDTADDSGNYSFSGVATGDYVVQSVHIDNGTRLLRYGVHVVDDTVLLSDDTLRRTGSIKIALPDSIDTVEGYAYIPGTTFSRKLAGIFAVFDSVPAGTIPEIVFTSKNTAKPPVLLHAVEVVQEDTATVWNTRWRYSRKIWLNTSATGAGIGQTLYRFPVLIRLRENSFDFSQSRSDGADCMFTKQSGDILPYEIERWDAANKLAEIWVRVDTLLGNKRDNVVIMYWGNPQASGGSDNRVVFDTAAGFSAVWHLAESTDTLHDASTNRVHGIRSGSMVQSSSMIGYGQQFGTGGAYGDMGNVLNPGIDNLTISAWVKRAATGLQTIMAKSNGGSPYASYGWTFSFGQADQLQFFAATSDSAWGSPETFEIRARADATVTDSTTWHFVAAVIDRSDNAGCRLYADGIDVTGGTNGDIASVGSLTNAAPLRIGAEADGGYKWTGGIDECVVANTLRSEAWLRLCYINQGTTDRLVEFR